MRRGDPPPELRRGHLLLDPGDPSQEDPPKMWAVIEVSLRGKTVKVKSAGFGESETRTLQADRIPHHWLFVHSELLAGLLSRHAATLDVGSDFDCAVCAVFGGPGTAESIQKAGH